jgi:hypothetical protein
MTDISLAGGTHASNSRNVGSTPARSTNAEQIATLQAKREQLLEQRRLRELQAEVDRLEQSARGSPALSTSSDISLSIESEARSKLGEEDIEEILREFLLPSGQDKPLLATEARDLQAVLPRVKNPTLFNGNDLKEARLFIRELEIVFVLLGKTYKTDRSRVLYGIMWLVGDAHEQ